MGKSMDPQGNLTDDTPEKSHIPMSPNVSPTSPLDLSINSRQFPFHRRSPSPSNSSIKSIEITCRQMSVDDTYEPPEVITQPKPEWHYRSIKDLAKNHLPYVAGNGPQRTPIRVKVPEMLDGQMYLAIAIRTIVDEPHPSKVIVPAKTYVNAQHLTHDNNLGCLRFDQCSPMDHFDVENRHIYSKISSTEHQVGYKEVRIHMFNLYQNHSLTKDIIVTKQLNQCKLAFWLCVLRNKEYVAVSPTSFSLIIEEKKMTNRSRVTAEINQPTMISNPYAQFYIDYNNNEGNTDDDDSF